MHIDSLNISSYLVIWWLTLKWTISVLSYVKKLHYLIFLIINYIILFSVRLDTDENYKLFLYSAYFYYYSWTPLHFLSLFMGPTVLFQKYTVIFTFIYSTFNNKFSVSVK